MRVTDHVSEPFEINSNVTVIGANLDGEMVSVTGYAEHYQFAGPMDAAPDETYGRSYATSDDTHLVYTFRDLPQLTVRWGDLVQFIDRDAE